MDKTQSVFEIVKHLHSETKLQLIAFISVSKEPLNVTNLTLLTKLQRKNVSKQLNELLKVGVLQVEPQGKERFYSINKDLSDRKAKMVQSIIDAYTFCDCAPKAIRTK